jgi:hypothetical protein
VDEVDRRAVDLGRELRQRVQPRLDTPEVVLIDPVARERLQRLQLDALRSIGDELLAGPARGGDAASQIIDLRFGNPDAERPNFGCGVDGGAHTTSVLDDPATRPYPAGPGSANVARLEG